MISRYIVVLMAFGLGVPRIGLGAPGDTELVSSSAATGAAAGVAWMLGMSPDARFVLFTTSATDVLPGGNPPALIIKDRLTGTAEIVAVGYSFDGDISANGRYVVFSSYDALVPQDTNGTSDVYLRDRTTRQTVRLSVSATGAQGNGISDIPQITPDGRFVLFASEASNLVPGDTNGEKDVFLRDLQLGTLQRVSLTSTGGQANGSSPHGSISADGRYVVFQSAASNLVPRDTNGADDMFVRDRTSGTVERVSVSSSGAEATGGGLGAVTQGGSISADGRFVGFDSYATNLVPGDTNGRSDAFVHDRVTGVTERVSVNSAGAQANATVWEGGMSADGRFVVLVSEATNLVAGDLNGLADLFVRDRQAGTTVRASLNSLGVQANGETAGGTISADGQLVLFITNATNLVDNDTNALFDIYAHEMGSGVSSEPYVLSIASIDFGKRTLQTTPGVQVILSNTSGAVLPIADIRTAGVDADQFAVISRCGTTVEVGSACTIRVTFTPTSVGPKTARLRVTAGASFVRSAPLAGVGVPAVLAVKPGALTFGTVAVGSVSAVQAVTIQNAGEADLPIHWIGLIGPDAGDFTKDRRCPGMIRPGRICHAFVTFAPISKGGQSAQLVVSPGASGARQFVTLTGNGS
jgi:Tol biopolymer transport system component